MNKKISVVINTYNASRHLVEVLESLTRFDEVVVCDMESTDDTVSIAKAFGCKVVTFPKGEHKICEPARDFAIHSASNEWVLVVDADEVVPDSLRMYLYETIADDAFSDAIAIPRKNMFLGKYVADTPDYQLRFFRQDKTYWPPIIHARPQVDGNVLQIPASRKDLYLIHLDDPDMSSRIDKMNRYTDYEVPKRIGKRRYGIGKLFFRPMWFFIRSYLLGKGYRDGRTGMIKAYMAMMYQITLMSKLMEADIRKQSDHSPKPYDKDADNR
ncbi:MAG: glycosyltransferase family 2 protein [Muribaculaceae bacterium]|nr:glycosyltransferase family 2 protein [Muribaculaceae bacterium]